MVVRMNPDGSLSPGCDEFRDHASDEADKIMLITILPA
jgi:hypothetical protein